MTHVISDLAKLVIVLMYIQYINPDIEDWQIPIWKQGGVIIVLRAISEIIVILNFLTRHMQSLKSLAHVPPTEWISPCVHTGRMKLNQTNSSTIITLRLVRISLTNKIGQIWVLFSRRSHGACSTVSYEAWIIQLLIIFQSVMYIQ
jgi:hypothetical protein